MKKKRELSAKELVALCDSLTKTQLVSLGLTTRPDGSIYESARPA